MNGHFFPTKRLFVQKCSFASLLRVRVLTIIVNYAIIIVITLQFCWMRSNEGHLKVLSNIQWIRFPRNSGKLTNFWGRKIAFCSLAFSLSQDHISIFHNFLATFSCKIGILGAPGFRIYFFNWITITKQLLFNGMSIVVKYVRCLNSLIRVRVVDRKTLEETSNFIIAQMLSKLYIVLMRPEFELQSWAS